MAGATVFAPSALAGRTRPAVLFTLTISGIDRDGTALAVKAYVDSTGGVSYPVSGGSVKVPAGHYVVAASVWRAADGNTQTLVADAVHVTGNTTVVLDAQGAVPVTATLAAAGATQQAQTVSLCIGTGGTELAGYLVEPGGTAYVKPMTSSVLSTVYQTYYQGTGTIYEQAGAFAGGIPAHPVYHAVPAHMARVSEQLRAGENVTPLQSVILTYDNCGTTTETVPVLPDAYTDYRTPGNWNVNLNFGPSQSQVQDDPWTQRNFKAGHSYSEVFGSAVTGPDADYPEIDGSNVLFSPENSFSDPVVNLGFDLEGKAKVTLRRGAALVKTQTIKFNAASTLFSAHLKKKTWYTLSAVASRWNPSGSLPAGVLLSTRVSMLWRFKFAPVTGYLLNAQALPITVTRFLPVGLGWYNDAPGGSVTAVRVYLQRGGGQPVPTPKYKLKSVKLQASANDGLTWHTLPATPHPGYWLIHVTNPTIGYISLRSIVTDVHGDSTTETIIRAYLVPNSQ